MSAAAAARLDVRLARTGARQRRGRVHAPDNTERWAV